MVIYNYIVGNVVLERDKSIYSSYCYSNQNRLILQIVI